MSDNILSVRLRLVPLTPDALEGMLEGDGSTAAVLLGVDPPAEWMEGRCRRPGSRSPRLGSAVSASCLAIGSTMTP